MITFVNLKKNISKCVSSKIYYGYHIDENDKSITYINGARCYQNDDLIITKDDIVFLGFACNHKNDLPIKEFINLEDSSEEEDNQIERPEDDDYIRIVSKY